jgi:excisionase family DNA binding protein
LSTHTATRDGTVLLSPADAARLAQVSRDTIREIERGQLPARHVGRQLRIDLDDFRAYLDRERAASWSSPRWWAAMIPLRLGV